MNFIKLNDITAVNVNPKIAARHIPSEFKSKSVNIRIQPGGILPMHTTPVDVIFYVISGNGTVIIGDERQDVSTGTFIDSPKDIPHGWENNDVNNELSILVIKLFS
ncbi:MAG: cupin domain-containing protein [Fusobacteria bacterium]|nr:cupin domain-containing protein [Fusobacteriota bacterium]